MRAVVIVGSMWIMSMAMPVTGKPNDKPKPSRPPVFEELVNCRNIAEPTERLSCYDQKVTAIDNAEKRNELMLADKQSVQEMRRGLFGFSLPKLRLFGNDDGKQEETELTSKVRSAYQASPGKWTIILEDGAKWVQIDTQLLNKDPKPGAEIKIRPAAMGSYFANVAGQRSIRMRRVN